jgi:hypothetical protein
MITYELTKKLKDAGFPQAYQSEIITEHGFMDEHSAKEMGYDYACIPTLSELIEACGEGEEGNQINLQYTRDAGCKASKQFRKTGDYIQVDGSTPEEAVALLYLKLHEKN